MRGVRSMRKIFFLGLDSAPPKIIYDEYGVELNALKEVVQESERYIMRLSLIHI